MSTTNEGGQIKHHPDFKHPATGRDFSRFLRGIVKPGIYEGGEVSYSGNQIIIAPFRAILKVGTDNFAHFETKLAVIKDVVAPNDIAYITYTYKEEEENWLDFGFRESINAPAENEVILCKINFSGSDIESVDNSYQTKGLFDSNFNVNVEGTITLKSTPLTQNQVGNVEFNDGRYMLKDIQERTLDDFRQRLQQTEEKMIQFSLENSYLMQRQSTNPNQLTETYFSEANTSNENNSFPKPCIIMDDDQGLYNNWKYRADGNPDFKNGFIKPSNRAHYMEETDIYDLKHVGQTYKLGMSHHDPINNCYWMITSSGYNNSDYLHRYGKLLKVSDDLKDGKVTVLAEWNLANLWIVDSVDLNTAYWSGIDVMTEVDENEEQFLFMTITNANAGTLGAGLAKLRINDDGTLGKNYTQNGNTLLWQETWTPNGDFHVCDGLNAFRTNTNYFWDCVVWDNQHVALLRHNHTSGEIYLMFKEIADNGLGSFVTTNPRSEVNFKGGDFMDTISNDIRPAMAKKGNKLFLKVNNNTSNARKILEIDVSEDEYDPEIGITANVESYTGDIYGSLRYTGAPGIDPTLNSLSGWFDVAQDADAYWPALEPRLEALAISRKGDLLEHCTKNDATYLPSTMHVRKLENVKYAEGQVSEVYRVYNSPNHYGFEFDPIDNDYLWMSVFCGTTNQVRLVKQHLSTQVQEVIHFSGGAWSDIFDICFAKFDNGVTDEWYCYLVGYDTSPATYRARVIKLSDLELALNTSVDIETLGNDFTGYSNEARFGICTDGNYLYIVNTVTHYIERWNLGDDLAQQPTIDNATYMNLGGESVNIYRGITWHDNLFYVVDSNTADAYRSVISVFKDTPQANGSRYQKHLYIENKYDFSNSTHGVAIRNGVLYTRGANQFNLFGQKTLIDPDVMQLHIHLNSRNVLQYPLVGYMSPIIKRHFKPEEFIEWLPVDENGILDLSGGHDHYEYLSSKENCPDENYLVVMYHALESATPGLDVLGLDEMLETSQEGEARYDVEKIKINQRFYKSEFNGVYSDQNIITSNGTDMTNVLVEKEMIFISTDGDDPNLIMIDLQKGRAQIFDHGYNVAGFFYSGRLKEGNLGLGYNTGWHNPDLEIPGDGRADRMNMCARTFFKEDQSDYSELNPVTYMIIGDDVGSHAMRIDWDSNTNMRTVTSVYKDIWNHADFELANFIAPSGQVFGAHWVGNGGLYMGVEPIWKMNRNNFYTYNNDREAVNLGNVEGNITEISKNSPVFKLPNGDWRHILYISRVYNSYAGLAIYDVENRKILKMDIPGLFEESVNVDNFEDRIWIDHAHNNNDYNIGLYEIEKVSFAPYSVYASSNQWIMHGNDNTQFRIKQYNRRSSPYYVLSADSLAYFTDANRTKIRYSKEHGILVLGSYNRGESGIQMLVKGTHENFCTHESVTQDTENPTQYYYIQSKISE